MELGVGVNGHLHWIKIAVGGRGGEQPSVAARRPSQQLGNAREVSDRGLDILIIPDREFLGGGGTPAEGRSPVCEDQRELGSKLRVGPD
jgi:hypothetical protein